MSQGDDSPKKLKQLGMTLLPLEECNKLDPYRLPNLSYLSKASTNFCAGVPPGFKEDVCGGDS